MRRTAVISIRTDEQLKKALEDAAEWDSRSLAGLVEKILKEWCVEKGYIRPPRTLARPAKRP
jgi:hypothetical protein